MSEFKVGDTVRVRNEDEAHRDLPLGAEFRVVNVNHHFLGLESLTPGVPNPGSGWLALRFEVVTGDECETDGGPLEVEHIIKCLANWRALVEEDVPACREKSLALAKIEEAEMWLGRVG